MITAQLESFEDRLDELKTLLPMHYKELALDQDKVPLDPQYGVYIAREHNGELIFATLRDAGALVGYFIGFIAPGLHYSTCLTCTMDILYVRKDKRAGRAGITLMRFVQTQLKRRGVQRWFVGSKLHLDIGALFKYMQFKPVETYYSMWLGD